LVALAGYVAPWVPHRAAGLVITGLDLAEYVKFLHPVSSGEIPLWREGFYLPLVAVSVAFSLYAFHRQPGGDRPLYPWPVRVGMLAVAGMAALNLLPPAWSPALLFTPEFRLQTSVMILCLILAGISPFLALAPAKLRAASVLLLTLAGLAIPVAQFWRILPALGDLYGHAILPGWGVWVMGVGVLGVGYWVLGIGYWGGWASRRLGD
jgi:hypothetical protein